eukprot:ANDGO_08203.mRNA.1 Uncharacterized protein MT1882
MEVTLLVWMAVAFVLVSGVLLYVKSTQPFVTMEQLLEGNASLNEWFHKGKFFKFAFLDSSFRVFFVDAGRSASSDVVVLLHGFPTSSLDFQPFLSKWSDHIGDSSAAADNRRRRSSNPSLSSNLNVRFIAVDFLGYGFSDKPQAAAFPPLRKYSTFVQADMVSSLLFHLGLHVESKRIHILAHDFGGTVAQELVVRKTLPIKSVCIMNGGIVQSAYRPLLIQKVLAISPLGEFLVQFVFGKAQFRRSMNRVFGANKPSSALIDAYWGLLCYREGYARIPDLLYKLHERKVFHERFEQALREIKSNFLYLAGPDDQISGRNMAVAVQKLLESEDSAKCFDAGVGHYPHVEVPHIVVREYAAFLQRFID